MNVKLFFRKATLSANQNQLHIRHWDIFEVFYMNCSIILALWTFLPEVIHKKISLRCNLKKKSCNLKLLYNFYLYKTITSSKVGS